MSHWGRKTIRWLELSIEAPGEYAETLAGLFARHCVGGVALEQAGGYNPDEGEEADPDAPVTVRGYIEVDDTTESRKGQIDLGIRLIRHLYPLPEMTEKVVEEESWRKQEFEPIRISKRLVIVPPGDDAEIRPGDVVVPLEPGLAFGTGHHPTTRMCLGHIERLVTPETSVLDVGCGSGILSIAALKLGASNALAIDIEEEALQASWDNLRRANFTENATVQAGSLPLDPDGASMDNRRFDLLLANISSKVLIDLAEELAAHMNPDGRLVASGFLDERRTEIEDAFAEVGLAFEDATTSGDWVAAVVAHAAG